MTPLFTLSMDRDLPIIVDAILHRRLQMFQPAGENNKHGSCLYTGPCAIGVLLPEELRAKLDKMENNEVGGEILDEWAADHDPDDHRPSLDSDISTLFFYNVLDEGDDEQSTWEAMQQYHDAVVSHKHTLAKARGIVDSEHKHLYEVEDRIHMTRSAIRSFFKFIREQITEHKLRNTFPQGD